MYRFIESICLREGKFQNLELHERRMHRAFASVRSARKINLEQLLLQQEVPTTGWWKCRVLYNELKEEISFEKYQLRQVSSLRIVKDDTIDYAHKYVDRSRLEKLYEMREHCDDIIILKNGKVTDSLYANLAFKKENNWFTSKSPLLHGVMREKLVQDQILTPAEITTSNIYTFEKVKLINALLGFDGPEIDIKNIVF
jgi:4-amino-4-deoxychorismate lyase